MTTPAQEPSPSQVQRASALWYRRVGSKGFVIPSTASEAAELIESLEALEPLHYRRGAHV